MVPVGGANYYRTFFRGSDVLAWHEERKIAPKIPANLTELE